MVGKTHKRTLRQDWHLIKRAVGIWNEILPRFWFWQAFCTLIETFAPYFGLYMSALMISELAGECNMERLFALAGITVLGGFFISVITRLVRSKCTLQKQLIQRKSEAYFTDVQNNLQYEHLENAEIVLLRSKIDATIASGGGGLELVKQSVQHILTHVLNIFFSVALTISVFTSVTEGDFDGFWAFINSPASGILLIAVIALNTILTVQINLKKTLAESRVVEDRARTHTFEVVWGSLGGHDVAINGFYKIFSNEFRKYLLCPAWVTEIEKVKVRYGILSIVLNAVLNVILFMFVAAKAFIGAFGIGNFLLYQGTTGRFINAVSGLASEFGKLRHNNVYLEELYTFLDLPNDMYKGSLAVEKRDDNDYEIEFRDVSFKYPRTENWVLRHVNMKFKIGDKLAIVGENGSGKTTFIKLLCRLYDPTEGKILLNGIDITRYRYHEYMALFSVVFQDFTLFAFSLGENVAADCTYDPDKVRDCLIRVGIGEKLASLDNDPQAKEKDGLKRSIGKDYDRQGIDFSGGEKQKIALARALYKDAPFLILDEPTASLDPIAEAAVYENFNTIVKDKTAVFISHRLSSCRFCDHIAVFDHGQIVQHGSHGALVADENGKYYELWHAQAQYYNDGV